MTKKISKGQWVIILFAAYIIVESGVYVIRTGYHFGGTSPITQILATLIVLSVFICLFLPSLRTFPEVKNRKIRYQDIIYAIVAMFFLVDGGLDFINILLSFL